MSGNLEGVSKLESETLVGLFDSLLAGACAKDIDLALQHLPDVGRQNFFCTACDMRDEVAANCVPRALEIDHLLSRNCPDYQNGARTCARHRAAKALIGLRFTRRD